MGGTAGDGGDTVNEVEAAQDQAAATKRAAIVVHIDLASALLDVTQAEVKTLHRAMAGGSLPEDAWGGEETWQVQAAAPMPSSDSDGDSSEDGGECSKNSADSGSKPTVIEICAAELRIAMHQRDPHQLRPPMSAKSSYVLLASHFRVFVAVPSGSAAQAAAATATNPEVAWMTDELRVWVTARSLAALQCEAPTGDSKVLFHAVPSADPSDPSVAAAAAGSNMLHVYVRKQPVREFLPYSDIAVIVGTNRGVLWALVVRIADTNHYVCDHQMLAELPCARCWTLGGLAMSSTCCFQVMTMMPARPAMPRMRGVSQGGRRKWRSKRWRRRRRRLKECLLQRRTFR